MEVNQAAGTLRQARAMQRVLKRRAVMAGFLAATIILLAVGWESHANAKRFAEAAGWQNHTYEVLNTLGETAARLDDAETGQRGYLLTGQDAYLKPYNRAILNLGPVIDHLKRLTSDNANQQKRIQSLEPLVENKLAELHATIDLYRKTGPSAVHNVVIEGSGKRFMDEIRVLIADMANEEKQLLGIRTQKANDNMERTSRTIIGGTVLSIFLLIPCFWLLMRELSERERAQSALEKSDEWLSTTLASIGDAVIATDMHGNVTFLNPVAQALTGWTPQDAQGKPMDVVFNIVNAETRQQVENPIKKVFREGKVVGLADHTILISKDGREFDIEDSAAPIITETGESFGVVLVFRDITENKFASQEIKRQKDLLQLILESMGDGVAVADAAGKFVLFNKSAEQLLGVGSTNADPQQWPDHFGLFYADQKTPLPPDEVPLTRAVRGESVDSVEIFVRHAKRAEGVLICSTARPLLDHNGALAGGVVVFHDITLQKLTEDALLLAKEEAERTSKFKDQFLSTMSHELRTPLNAVLGFSDLLADPRYGALNDRQQRYVTHIHSGGEHLLKLINDILDLSKIEAGKMELTREDVNVSDSFAEVISSLYPLAAKKSHVLVQQADSEWHVRADSMRFKQVLMNLVGNAIKFSPDRGRIELAAKKVGEQIRIEVRDEGPGIPPEDQQRLFEAFYRLSQPGAAVEGTGLGLAITSKLLEMHGSKLEIDSESGCGSCFYFLLPIVEAVARPQIRPVASKSRGDRTPRIMVVEDNVATGQLIQSQLASSGYETIRCDRPEQALKLAAELQPDAITLDLLMKPVHGLEVLLQLKNDPRTLKIPVIVVTILDQPGVGGALGADEYLVKPVDKQTLLSAVERCLRSRGGSAPARPILVVEDDQSTREVVVDLLTSFGYAVTTACDGAEARASVADSLPALIILDLVLPKMSGLELLAEWRATPRTSELSVFVLTSKDLSKEEERYIHAHAESLFLKQSSWREALINQLERVVTPTAVNS
jgi:PAS domain S-box-containing protein